MAYGIWHMAYGIWHMAYLDQFEDGVPVEVAAGLSDERVGDLVQMQ
jgi:hypothetical protein